MRRRFFVEDFDASGRSAELRGEQAHHLGRVLRAQAGQLYELSDGSAVWLGRVERVTKDAVEFSLVEAVAAQEARLRTTLLLSIVKFDRFEWCLEKATELGAAEIVPLAAARSEKTLVAAAAKRAARWEKILLESAQQARRLRPPMLREMVRSDQVFAAERRAESLHQNGYKVLLSERPAAPMLKSVWTAGASERCELAFGPEGGWTDEELLAARAAGFIEASLGSNILRTETAVIAALAVVNFALAGSD
ncbi:MAG: RsmE family RNA methyltransferase [Candidatus Acidiferrales bacterium]